MLVIFLDIDGVLNNEATKEIVPDHKIRGTDNKLYNITGVNPRLVKMLLDWAADKDIHFVLSSTWRLTPSMMDHLRLKGLDWLMETPEDIIRGCEIQAILDYGFIDNYVILDDFSSKNFLKTQLRNYVQTSAKHGLRPQNLTKIEKILWPVKANITKYNP